MLSVEELASYYQKLDDDTIIQLASSDSKSLRADVIPVLKKEIIKRGLNPQLLSWVSQERNFFTEKEEDELLQLISKSKCSHCQSNKNEIKGFHIYTISIFNSREDIKLIVCNNCGKKLKRKSYLITATLGWLWPASILWVPYYFISELFNISKQNDISKKIIEQFIFVNTGLIRELGFANIEKVMEHHNAAQYLNP